MKTPRVILDARSLSAKVVIAMCISDVGVRIKSSRYFEKPILLKLIN